MQCFLHATNSFISSIFSMIVVYSIISRQRTFSQTSLNIEFIRKIKHELTNSEKNCNSTKVFHLWLLKLVYPLDLYLTVTEPKVTLLGINQRLYTCPWIDPQCPDSTRTKARQYRIRNFDPVAPTTCLKEIPESGSKSPNRRHWRNFTLAEIKQDTFT